MKAWNTVLEVVGVSVSVSVVVLRSTHGEVLCKAYRASYCLVFGQTSSAVDDLLASLDSISGDPI